MKRWLIALPLAALLAACSVQSQGTVPLRAKAEAMGARVDWNEAESSVILRYEGSAVRLYPASGTMLVDGRRHSLGAPLEVRKGRTMISPAAWTQVSDALKRGGKAITGFKQVAQFAVPGQRAEIVAATPDGSRVVVTQADLGRIAVVNVRDLANIRLEATIPFQDMVVTGEVTSAAITPDGRYALVVVRAGDNLVRAYPGSLYVVDLATRRVAGGHLLGIGPDAIAISRDGTVAV
ncbi:MAG TPA: stalk domain-containing protein, partial [Symbiobacteriaceae bacterium]|nr:stalk domain-containing protein [Symbiobacteriaceae bacterium]